MRIGRLRTGEWVAAVAALVLFVAMFLDWYGVDVSGSGGSVPVTGMGGSAWETLEVLPAYLVVTVLAALLNAILRLRGSEYEPPLPLNVVVAILGGVAVLSILGRIAAPPDLGNLGGIPVGATCEFGAFLALLAAAGIAYGGYRAMGEEGMSFAAAAERLSARGSEPPPAG